VLVDEAHHESWTFSAAQAAQVTPNMPEYCFMGHLADLSAACLDTEFVVNELPFEAATFEGCDVMMMSCPSREGFEPVFGSLPALEPSEAAAVRHYVQSGGGLILLGEHQASFRRTEVNEHFGELGATFCPGPVVAEFRLRDVTIATDHFFCYPARPVEGPFAEVSHVSFHRGCALELTGSAQPLLMSPAGFPVAACARVGDGRVVWVGDSDLFSLPFISFADNAMFLVAMLAWAAGADDLPARARAATDSFLTSEVYSLRTSDGGASPPTVSIAGSDSWRRLVEEYEHIGRGNFSTLPDVDDVIATVETTAHDLPVEARLALLRFKRIGNASGALIVKGLDLEGVAEARTPESGVVRSTGPLLACEWQFLQVATLLGDPFSYLQEKHGLMFQDVVPVEENADKLSSESSVIDLTFHTEVAFHPFMPSQVLLMCLRQSPDGGGATYVASVRDALEQLPIGLRACLFEDRFVTGIDFSFGSQSGLSGNGPQLPVLFGDPYDPLMKFDLDLMEPIGHRATEALRRFGDALASRRRSVLLEVGDLMVIDNRRAVHGREPFSARYDGADRWLVRVLVLPDISAVEERRQREKHMITTRFAV
jgi:TfdA family taurine catabolism dioxygenase TauD